MSNRYTARASYYGADGYTPSPGLQRARAPFRNRNLITGAAIVGFVASVYFYSISAVKQDDFSDLPAISPAAGSSQTTTIEEDMAAKGKSGGPVRGIGAMMGIGSSPQGEGERIQIVPDPAQTTKSTLPLTPISGALGVDPSRQPTSSARSESRFIANAPDVDRIGRIGDRSAMEEKRLV